jgi:hypothetical protein
MSGSLEQCTETQEGEDTAAWSQEAGMILTALEAGGWNDDRRKTHRLAYRVKAALGLFADPSGAAARVLYTRDADHRGIGFVTRERLPLGYGGILRVAHPQDHTNILSIPCTLVRCRPAAQGWYEGAAHFNRDQAVFQTPPAAETEEK